MQRRFRVGLGVATLVAVALAAVLVSPAVLLAWFDALAARPGWFVLLVVVAAVVRPVFAWPTSLLAIAVGYAFGLWGIPFALLALTVTSIPPYYFGTLSAETGRLTTAGKELIAETGGVRGVAAARLFPLPSDVLSVAAGVARVRLGSYLVGTLFGELPWAILGVLIGISLDRLQRGSMTGLVDPWILAGMAAVAVLLLAGPCYRLFLADDSASAGTTDSS